MVKHILLLVISAWLAGCGPKADPVTVSAEPGELSYASTFSLQQHDGYTVITVKQPWQGAGSEVAYYLVPKDGKVPASLAGKPVIRTPVERVVSLSTSYLPMISMLGEAGTVKGFPDTSLIADELYAEQALTDLGNGTQIDRELLLETRPEVVFGFGVSEPAAIERIAVAAGYHMVYNTDYLEDHPLGRAEWIRFFGAFYDKQSRADSLFRMVRDRYDSLVQEARAYDAAPSVMASNLYGDTWYMPGGDSWVATFIDDAGGSYLWADTEGTGSLNLAFEPVLQKAQNADIWINASNYRSLEGMATADGRYRYFKPWQTGRVYNPLRKGKGSASNTYYELGYARPDLVLADLIRILHPEAGREDSLHFYQKLN